MAAVGLDLFASRGDGDLLRYRQRYESHVQFAGDQRRRQVLSAYVDREALQLDVQETLAQLSQRDQLICQALARDESLAEIARRLGCGWHTLARAVARIRAHFQARGLDRWVLPS